MGQIPDSCVQAIDAPVSPQQAQSGHARRFIAEHGPLCAHTLRSRSRARGTISLRSCVPTAQAGAISRPETPASPGSRRSHFDPLAWQRARSSGRRYFRGRSVIGSAMPPTYASTARITGSHFILRLRAACSPSSLASRVSSAHAEQLLPAGSTSAHRAWTRTPTSLGPDVSDFHRAGWRSLQLRRGWLPGR